MSRSASKETDPNFETAHVKIYARLRKNRPDTEDKKLSTIVDKKNEHFLKHKKSLNSSSVNYLFDGVFGQTVTNEEIFNSLIKKILNNHLEYGQDGVLFFYGKIFGGKSYSILGDIYKK